MQYEEVNAALAGSGLICRGGFHPEPTDGVPEPGGPVATVVIVGNAGPEMWQAFSAAVSEDRRQSEANPLNDWTRDVISGAAAALGAAAVYPFDGPPYLPFQRWAMRADDVHVSPIGPLIHPEYGLWHAYRGALLLAEQLDTPAGSGDASPCDSCADKPCLNTCPVDAFGAEGYDVPACRDHLAVMAGEDCLGAGCLARRACPIGRDYIYEPDQARFHMQRFLTSSM
jgi:hypothetical protein